MDVQSLIDAETTPNTKQCRVCAWLEGLEDEAERAAWDAAMAKKANSHKAIFRAIRKRGYQFGDGSVSGHRNSLHRQ